MNATNGKIFAAGLSRLENGGEAAAEAARQILKGLNGAPCDALIAFVADAYPEDSALETLQELASRVNPENFLACNANGAIGGESEIEFEPAVSALAVRAPGASFLPFELSPEGLGSLDGPEDLALRLALPDGETPRFLCLADPMSCDVEKLLSLFNEAWPGAPVAGGLASGGVLRKPNLLYLNGRPVEEGVAGLAVTGDLEFATLVSQGCRPVGEPFIITKSDRNLLLQLRGRAALDVLMETVNELSPGDRALAQRSLFAGLAMNEEKAKFARGDFLVRNILGADRESGAVAIGELPHTGQTVQFHVRDAAASTEDLTLMLESLKELPSPAREGALLVSCCGRGKGLFGTPGHDARLIQSLRGPIKMAGFFANGEFGPVNGRNYVHGYTSSLTILR